MLLVLLVLLVLWLLLLLLRRWRLCLLRVPCFNACVYGIRRLLLILLILLILLLLGRRRLVLWLLVLRLLLLLPISRLCCVCRLRDRRLGVLWRRSVRGGGLRRIAAVLWRRVPARCSAQGLFRFV